MNKDLQQIQEASAGLLFISESDQPFEVVGFKSNEIESEIRKAVQKPAATPIEEQAVDYFFRNMVKTYPGYSREQEATALRFLKLKELLRQKLNDPRVYRIGSIQVDAFILGKLQDGTIGGLR